MVKLLFVAVDGMSAQNAKFLGDQMGLPSGPLKSLPGNMNTSGPAWTSIYTGVSHKKHGVTTAWGYPSDTSKGFAELEYPCIWDFLNAGGHTCGLYGIPMTYPVRKVFDWAVAGFCRSTLSPPEDLFYNIRTRPTEFVFMDIVEAFVAHGKAETTKEWRKVKDVGGIEDLIEIADNCYRERFDLLKTILAQQPVDFLFVSLEAFDRFGHLGFDTKSPKVRGLVGKWFEYITCGHLTRYDDIFCVADHGFNDRTHDHSHTGGVMSSIGLPESVLCVKDCILHKYFGNEATWPDAEIAPLNNECVTTDETQIRTILESLGYA